MPLEATMIIVDNSEYMLNGDYAPDRYLAQGDAVNAIFNAKIDSNPENTVGIMSMAAKAPEVLVTHSKSHGQILDAMHKASNNIGGAIDIPTAIAIAQLALKHRENKNLRQRIIVFVGSPLLGNGADEKAMVKLAKKLKKNNVAIDVVAFGDGIEEETSVLKTFTDAASSSDNSHYLSVVPGPTLISDALKSCPILAGDLGTLNSEIADAEGGGAGGAGGAGGNDFEFGVDPSLDPELAMVLRMSMQEAQARQDTAEPTTAGASSSSSAPDVAAPVVAAAASSTPTEEDDDDDEDAMLAQALALSAQDNNGEDVNMEGDDDEDEDDEDEEAAIARAIQMSMNEAKEKEKK